jgi:cytochrome b involved in lipid metabolism
LEAAEQREREEEMPTLTKLYSLEDAARHNTADDCWVVVDGKVSFPHLSSPPFLRSPS